MNIFVKVMISFVCVAVSVVPTTALVAQNVPQTDGLQQLTAVGSIVGVPWTGKKGITETVAQIMEREKNAPAIDAAHPKVTKRWLDYSSIRPAGSPSALAVSQWPPEGPVAAALRPLSPQTLGTSFKGVGLSESGYIPPDSMGDVGPTQILVHVNGRIKVFDKSGNLGPLNVTDATFWASVTTGISDPEVRYDRLTGRWYILAITVAETTNNKIVVAVSSGPAITGQASFTFYSFNIGAVAAGDVNSFCDYPSLGVDVNALYTGCNMFSAAGAFQWTSVYVIRKSSVTSGGPIVATGFSNISNGTAGPGPYTPRGVDNDDPQAIEGYYIGPDLAILSRLQIRRVSNPGGTPTLSGNLTLNVPQTTNMNTQPALGSTTNIDAADTRLFMATIHRNKITGFSSLWTAHEVEVDTTGTGQTAGNQLRIGARWYEIQNLTTTPSLRQSGTLFTSTACTGSCPNQQRGYIYPTVAETGQGHMVLGATYASSTEWAGVAVAGRFRTDTLGTTQAATIAQAGLASYTVLGSGRNRWGDYSFTAVDPNDDQTVWTFQEYADSPANNWAVRAIQLKAPLPATPASISAVAKGQASAVVTVTGTSVAGTEFFDPGPDTGGPGYASHITATLTGATGVVVNNATFVDPTHLTLNLNTINATQGCPSVTVTITNPDGQTAAGTFPLNVGPVWVGGGGNSNWSNANNWAPAAVPGSSDLALFDPACVMSANATVDTNQTVGSVTIKSGYIGTLTQGSSNLIINGAYQQQGGTVSGGAGTITVGGIFNLTGGTFTAPSGGLQVTGNFTNTASFVPNGGTVTFNGAGLQSLVGDTTFNNVAVSTNVTLSTSSLVTVTALTNSGWTIETLAIAGTPPFTQSFGLANVKISVGTLGTLNALQIIRRDQNHPNATVGTLPSSTLQTGRYWTITPNSEGTFSVTLVLPHNNVNLPKVCKYPGGLGGAGWDCAADGSTTTTVWRSGISNLSDWAVGANVSPTAIHLNKVEAHSESTLPVLLLSIMLMLSLSIVVAKRRWT